MVKATECAYEVPGSATRLRAHSPGPVRANPCSHAFLHLVALPIQPSWKGP